MRINDEVAHTMVRGLRGVSRTLPSEVSVSFDVEFTPHGIALFAKAIGPCKVTGDVSLLKEPE